MVNIKVTNVASREVVFVEVPEHHTIRQLKACIEGRGLGPVHLQRLAHAGRVLSDEMTILDSGISSIPSVVLSVQAAFADPTVGALSAIARNRSDTLEVNSRVVPTLLESHDLPEDDDTQDINIPTCRICHGNVQ